MFAPVLLVSAFLLKPIATSVGLPVETQTVAQSAPPIAPVPLPDASLSDADYKTALTTLLTDGSQRPGVEVSLLRYLPPPGSGDPIPAHARVIVELMDHWISSPNQLETLYPLRVVARCGATALPESGKVLALSRSILRRVRVAAAEALGGLYAVGPGMPATAPPVVRTTLVRLASSDDNPTVEMMAALAIGHDRITDPAALSALTSLASGTDNGSALGALNAAARLGPDAQVMLPSIKKCLADPQRVGNAAPALIAVDSPADSIDTIAAAITSTRDPVMLESLLYYAGHFSSKNGIPDLQPLVTAIRPLLDALPETAPAPEVSPAPSSVDAAAPLPSSTPAAAQSTPTPAERASLRIVSAQAYAALTNDLKTATQPLIELTTASDSTPAVRLQAITAIQSLGPAEIKNPAVVRALVNALGDSDTSVQNVAIAVLFKYAGPASAAAAPRLAELLQTAWQNKQEGRVFTLINAIYRIGPIASHSVTPILKRIRDGEPAGSANARFADVALQRMTQ